MNEDNATANCPFNIGDRVVRKNTPGPQGTVQKIRVDTARASIRKTKEGEIAKGVSVAVLWDNGTLSHFVPESLDRA